MNFLYSLALTVSPSPDETLAPGVEESDVTPGLLGFIVTLFLVVCVVFLIRDMVRRIRRVRYRDQVVNGNETGDDDDDAPASGEASASAGAGPAGAAAAGSPSVPGYPDALQEQGEPNSRR